MRSLREIYNPEPGIHIQPIPEQDPVRQALIETFKRMNKTKPNSPNSPSPEPQPEPATEKRLNCAASLHG